MLTISLLFVALLFMLGLITTLFNFPTKKFQSWIFSLSVNPQTPTPKAEDSILAEKKSICSSNSHGKVELRGVFATFDKNNDGFITKQELKQSLKNIGIFMEDGDILEMVEKVDSNKDGLISGEELSKVLSSLGLNQGKRLDDCKEMIRNVDVDGDGMVNFDEFKKMMRDGGRLIPIS